MGSLVVTVPLTEEFSSAQKQSVYIALATSGYWRSLPGCLWRCGGGSPKGGGYRNGILSNN